MFVRRQMGSRHAVLVWPVQPTCALLQGCPPVGGHKPVSKDLCPQRLVAGAVGVRVSPAAGSCLPSVAPAVAMCRLRGVDGVANTAATRSALLLAGR